MKHIVNNWTFSLLGSVQSGRPYPVSTGDGFFTGSAFRGTRQRDQPAAKHLQRQVDCSRDARAHRLAHLWRLTSVRSQARTWRSARRAWRRARQPASLIVRLCKPHSPRRSTQATGKSLASASGPVDSYAGTPVDFQFLNGNLVRNAGLSAGLTRFDISLLKAIRDTQVGDRQRGTEAGRV